ncbi:PTS sugar transporter subunit IIA [Bacillus sp. REN16]|uniref:PTS sugar transporter subunit IIA n=1 Tax=Bacillus sp. REN16 TaxID=2887296 RepID=UPI001E56AF33|nr:PTS sugar transporter subunit IIA [Bacillus sp. REN16]MCC3356825.1 PTS sugar transporter subunit IIA [Bacillus sp. REN16]
MIGVLIISHGKFSTEILKSAELIIGRQENVATLHLNADDDIQLLRQKVNEQIYELDQGEGVLILTDLFGGSPSNVALATIKNMDNVYGISGVNLPMVIEALMLRHSNPLDKLTESCCKSAAEGIKNLTQLISPTK